MNILLRQQIIGTLNIALFVWVTYLCFGLTVLSNSHWRLLLALCLGAYTAYVQFNSTRTIEYNLIFEPEGPYKTTLDNIIQTCKVDPKTIRVRYGHTQGSLALSMLNTIALDPMAWNEPDTHTSIDKARDNITTHIFPTLPQTEKDLLSFCKNQMTPACQSFIVKHEVGHIVNHCSIKRVVLTGCIMAAAVFTGITSLWLVLPYAPGIISVCTGILVGACIDYCLSLLSNLFFRYPQEKYADIFAARYSSLEELEAAAIFFEKHQDFLDKTTPKTMLSFFNGTMDGKKRALFLRTLAQQNANTGNR